MTPGQWLENLPVPDKTKSIMATISDLAPAFTHQTSGAYLHHLQTSLGIELTRRLELEVTWG